LNRIFTYDEKPILEWVAEGDEQAFAVLFERYSDETYSFAIAYTKTAETAMGKVRLDAYCL
jgi:hypothetical protein